MWLIRTEPNFIFFFLVSHAVDLLASFSKSGHKPKTELRVKSYGRFKFRLQFSAFCSIAAGPPALGSFFFSVRPECVRIDIRASARILMHSFLYLFLTGACPEIQLGTLCGHIANRASALGTFIRFSSFSSFSAS
jgi:hypothetical protein